MPLYDGFLTVDGESVHVILGVEEDRLTLSTDGNEIGNWARDEIAVADVGEGVYTISAESETLRFVPNDQRSFAIAFRWIGEERTERRPDAEDRPEQTEESSGSSGDLVPPTPSSEAPPPQPVTRVAFYILTAVTVVLGAWAVVSLIMT